MNVIFVSLVVRLASVYFAQSCSLMWVMRRSSRLCSSCLRISLLIHIHQSILYHHLYSYSRALCVSAPRGHRHPSLIILQFAIGRPYPRPLHLWHQQTDFLAPCWSHGQHYYARPRILM
jgi:hypothetical protein